MCNHPNCIYIDILEMTNGEKLYIHYDNNLVPHLFQYYDEDRKIDKEYVPVEPPENIHLLISEKLFIFNGTAEIDEIDAISLDES